MSPYEIWIIFHKRVGQQRENTNSRHHLWIIFISVLYTVKHRLHVCNQPIFQGGPSATRGEIRSPFIPRELRQRQREVRVSHQGGRHRRGALHPHRGSHRAAPARASHHHQVQVQRRHHHKSLLNFETDTFGKLLLYGFHTLRNSTCHLVSPTIYCTLPAAVWRRWRGSPTPSPAPRAAAPPRPTSPGRAAWARCRCAPTRRAPRTGTRPRCPCWRSPRARRTTAWSSGAGSAAAPPPPPRSHTASAPASTSASTVSTSRS